MSQKNEDLDNDLKELRVRNLAIGDTKTLLPRLLREEARKWSKQPCSSWCQQIIQSLDYFQEDPQLLDPHLAEILPPVISKYLDVVQTREFLNHDTSVQSCAHKLSVILYTLCKVRGRKVVSRFLNNEPRYLDPILRALHTVAPAAGIEDVEDPFSKDWQQCFVLAMWLGHLILTPFDLSTISSGDVETNELRGLELPSELPSIAVEALKVGIHAIGSSSHTQSIWAELLVRLALRPDMQKAGVLGALLEWALSGIQDSHSATRIHYCLGLLAFVNGIIVSAHVQLIATFISRIFDLVNDIFNADNATFDQVNSSAVAKKLAVKVHRNIVVQLIQAEKAPEQGSRSLSYKMLQERQALEDVIDFLLRSLADRDTQVRLAASKGLSVIAQKLDQEQGEEIVEAILGSLSEDVFSKGDGTRSLEAVNPLRWHGLTLTLAHLLFRRSASHSQIPDILDALYLALVFEQKSTTGNSIGGNVRDAANFGLWSLARRFTTAQIEASYEDEAHISEASGPSSGAKESPLQKTANVLVASACFDPVGNVRRGSSAALQELIGRHPNTIQEGIFLIQVVDYHAVGLRSRAIEDVPVSAAQLGTHYQSALMNDIHDWRGVFAADETSRKSAAVSLGRLAGLQSREDTIALINATLKELKTTKVNDMVRRHGLIVALAAVIRRRAEMIEKGKFTDELSLSSDSECLRHLWHSCKGSLVLPKKEAGRTSADIEMAAAAILSLQCEMARYAVQYSVLREDLQEEMSNWTEVYGIFTECIQSVNIQTQSLIADGCDHLCKKLFGAKNCFRLTKSWIKKLEQAPTPSKFPGLLFGLGCMWGILLDFDETTTFGEGYDFNSQANDILNVLLASCSRDIAVEARVIGLRSLLPIVKSRISGRISDRQQWETRILRSVYTNLHDHTINERGDVGSLVRIESTSVLEQLWKNEDRKEPVDHSMELACYCQVAYLALEKLDKVRLQAARCLQISPFKNMLHPLPSSLADVGTHEYFFELLCFLATSVDAKAPTQLPPAAPTMDNMISDRPSLLLSVFGGISNSAGGGSDSVMQIARAAFLDFIDGRITLKENSSQHAYPVTLHDLVGKPLLENFERSLSQGIDDRDRVEPLLLSMTAFLLDMCVLQRLPPTQFKWRTLLSLVQKSHYKSTSVPKLLLALDVYRGLAGMSFELSNGQVPDLVRAEARAKIVNMMEKHPYVKVRTRAADMAWCVCGGECQSLEEWVDGSKSEDKKIMNYLKSFLDEQSVRNC
ncbi:MAG: hypothetical protein M1831_002774 [Alyxoria varia]|nr:MAG: hypothetical protein M1831_002774 [Alyxoria varia]